MVSKVDWLASMREAAWLFDSGQTLQGWNQQAATVDLVPTNLLFPGLPLHDLLDVIARSAPVATGISDMWVHDRVAQSSAEGSWADEVALSDGRVVGVSFFPVADDASLLLVHGAALARVDATGNRQTGHAFVSSANVQDMARATPRARKRSDSSFETIGRLASGLGHEINNLLAVITGNLEIAQLHPDPNRVAAALDNALTSAWRGASLTRTILGVGRSNASGLEPADLGECVGELVHFLERVLPESIVLDLALSEADIYVQLDRGWLASALLTMVLGARDRMPDGGVLHIGVLRGQGEAGIRVSGTAERPDQESALPRAPGAPGAYEVHRFARECGGRVTVDAGRNGELTTTVWLPISSVVEFSTAPGDPSERVRGLRVLLVEDDAAVRGMLISTLEEFGMDVRDVRDAPAALACFHDSEVDLVITDLGLPGIDGLELSQRLRGQVDDLPLVYYTGHIDPAPDALIQGVPLLKKPFRGDELRDGVLQALGAA